jgi:hypothetical protein
MWSAVEAISGSPGAQRASPRYTASILHCCTSPDCPLPSVR